MTLQEKNRPARTLAETLARGADRAPALLAPERPSLTYGGLRRLVADGAAALRERGIGPADKVGLVIPNGPEAASAFLVLASAAVAAPLNPAYTEDEYAFYLDDLKARALVVPAGFQTPAVAAARRLGITVLPIEVDPAAPAGVFTFGDGRVGVTVGAGAIATPDALSLVLHTSGTTSRPKIVPLSQANLAASADHIVASLNLTADDRCLNIMPLFHIHGLIAAVLASLAAGAGVCCTPGFNALRFFGWMRDVQPTWYTAVPTMHQAIVARAGRQDSSDGQPHLRFIRSSSASLPPQVMTALEEAFGCPVIEAYGMTEAAHQMSSNPLPPGERRSGSVGVAAGPRISIRDSAGAALAAGVTGEVCIQGPNVTAGYENNPEANASGFVEADDGRWFRTGDQGVLDASGYLTITGRLKEIINRGGEKVSPREVDEVLLDHPAVAQAVTFAVPHRSLGEAVAAAVVPRDGAAVDEAALRAFAGERLARFKVPEKILL
ncbi:MAG: acyl--CoA ligase, partial [Alphaproteobacteria bacterium]